MKTHSNSKRVVKISSRRLKTSNCRGRSNTKCRIKNGCKFTKSGDRKSYCRSVKNRSR